MSTTVGRLNLLIFVDLDLGGVVECLPSMCKAMGLTSSITKRPRGSMTGTEADKSEMLDILQSCFCITHMKCAMYLVTLIE
jgi:hypothetical protein